MKWLNMKDVQLLDYQQKMNSRANMKMKSNMKG